MDDNRQLDMRITLSRKLNLGKYESAEVTVSLGGITPETTEDQLVEMVEGQGGLAYTHLKKAMVAKVKEVRDKLK